jgi:hypothetical protein
MDPISLSRPTARAPSIVAISSTRSAVMISAFFRTPFWVSAANFMACSRL